MTLCNLIKLNLSDLRDIATELDIKTTGKKLEDLSKEISGHLDNYETYRSSKAKYKIYEKLGNSGKEGTTFLVKTRNGTEYAMKCFRNRKSINTLYREAILQSQASRYDISPSIVDVDYSSRSIIMEKMDCHLYDKIQKQRGELNITQQKDVIRIFKELDNAGVFQGDSNILNYMYKDKKLYIIDFGMAKEITPQLKAKLKTDTPNMCLMLIAFVIKLKDIGCSPSSYKYLIEHISKENKEKYSLI
jgi:tRNA A-37 threonylcarbamoyl transferase component Bud32